MGLFDKLLGRGQARPDDKAIIQNSSSDLPLDASEIEKAISESASHLCDFKKIPLGEIATLGGMFAQLSPALRTVAQTVSVDGMGS